MIHGTLRNLVWRRSTATAIVRSSLRLTTTATSIAHSFQTIQRMASTTTTTTASTAIDNAASRKALITATENWVRSEMSRNDGSHDYHHIERVRANAMSLARDTVATSATTAATVKNAEDWIIDSDTLTVVELA